MHEEVITECTHAVPASGMYCPECNASRLAVEFSAQLRRGEPLSVPQKYVKGLAEDLLKQCEENAALKLLLSQIVSSEPCRLDHHGYCQEHLWVGKGECAHGRARKFLDHSYNLREHLTTAHAMLMRLYENAKGHGDSTHAVTRWELDTVDYQALEDFLFPKDRPDDDT